MHAPTRAQSEGSRNRTARECGACCTTQRLVRDVGGRPTQHASLSGSKRSCVVVIDRETPRSRPLNRAEVGCLGFAKCGDDSRTPYVGPPMQRIATCGR